MAVAAPARDREAAQVDARFRDLDRSDRPGCSVGVSRRGATVLARGYGMANLDYGSHNTAGTAFYVASVAKQITGLVVALLIHDGVLGIDDDVRTYIPQLPDYGTPVRIEHLLHHTSGVRDYASLASYAGMRAADLLTTADALDFIVKQHQLDFAPGTRWSYSSSNYLLLARVVEKVTGKPFREVAQQRIFEPLGMTHARFREDHASIIPGRATGCVRTAGGLRTAELNGDPVGQGGP
jgi:CubicO group peptidase (beta-lactamase class C family)